MLNVIHEEKNGNVYANIAAPHRFPRAWTPRRSSNEKRMIDVNSTPFEEIEALPDFIKEKMKSSEEYRGRLKHEENMSGARGNRPGRVGAEMAADEADDADRPADNIDPVF